jgi:hypothetical protein
LLLFDEGGNLILGGVQFAIPAEILSEVIDDVPAYAEVNEEDEMDDGFEKIKMLKNYRCQNCVEEGDKSADGG